MFEFTEVGDKPAIFDAVEDNLVYIKYVCLFAGFPLSAYANSMCYIYPGEMADDWEED